MSPIGETAKNNRRGSLLLESLLTAAIASVGLIVIVQSIVAAHRVARWAGRYREAAMALDNLLAERLFEGAAGLKVDEEGVLSPPFDRYRYRLSLSPLKIDGNNPAHLRVLTARIEWNQANKARSLEVESIVRYVDDSAPSL